MKTQAAVLWEPGRSVEILEVDLAAPQEGEVLVRIAACGVCHSDLHVVDGHLPEPLPLVLGHEAAGVVEETGPGVRSHEPGDHVVLALVPSCGECEECRRGRPNFCTLGARMAAEGTLADGTSRLSLNGRMLHHFNSISAFAGHAVVPESAAVKIRDDVALDSAALVGCSVLTGFGAVANTAGVEEGATVAGWGCGGVGANVVQAGEGVDAVAAVKDVTGGGPDYAFEAIGSERAIQEAWRATRAGGTVVVVGIMPRGSSLTIDPWQFMSEKTLKGTFLGSARIQEDVPRLVELYHSGELDLDRLVSRKLPLAELPDAFDRLRDGDVVRQVVVFA